ncbi:MAG: HAD-IC family P-type ATPase, partial [Oscillospiraceae bacterium]|nr:HAD-IC family P-type ATPase [Oscillospiraceae bacterium]
MQGKSLLDRELTEEKLSADSHGLTTEQARERLAKYGTNTLASQKKARPLKIFIGQFKDVMVIILLIATVISFLLGEITDAVTITVIVALNALLGFIQEYRTEKTLLALKNMSAPSARVWRDGHLVSISSEELVPDDVIALEAGDKVPADAVILSARSLSADESILTGESVPAPKSVGNIGDTDNRIGRTDMLYSGTVITKGSGEARIIATGENAQMGKISGMLTDIEQEETPLQKRLGELGKIVALICLAVCIIVSGAGILRGEPVFEMLMTGITIAIAAIPEGLPATVTISLALAVSRMLKQNALVHKLHSVETLGCANVICTDKTGTITENKMTVKKLSCGQIEYSVSGTGTRKEGDITDENGTVTFDNTDKSGSFPMLIRNMILCGNSDIYSEKMPTLADRGRRNGSEWQITGDPTEAALLIAAAKAGADIDSIRKAYPRTDEIPFESETRCMS